MSMSLVKPYLSLTNILLPDLQVNKPPSLEDNLPSDFDFELRVRGCDLIQFAGVLLKLPQVSIATAQLLYQRFFFIKSFVKYNFEVVAMAATFLASKIDESPRRPRDVINAFHHIRQIENKEKIQPLLLDQYYINVKNQVIKSERRILKELGFAVHSQHPHKLLIIYLQTLECERNQRLVQIAWNYLNDSYKTNAFMCYQPPSIACSSIYMAARHLQLPLPNNPPWYSIFNVTIDEIRDICANLFKLYIKPKLSYKMIDKTLTIARKLYEINKASYKDSPNDSGITNSPVKIVKDSLDLPNSQASFSTEPDSKETLLPDQNKTIASLHKIDEHNSKGSKRREKDSVETNQEHKRGHKHHKNKRRPTPTPSPRSYKREDDKDSDTYSNRHKRHKSSRNKPAQDSDLDNLVLARQRQSLLYSIQEQKQKTNVRGKKSISSSEDKAISNKAKESIDRLESKKDTTHINTHDSISLSLSSTMDEYHKGGMEKDEVKGEIYPNNHGEKIRRNGNNIGKHSKVLTKPDNTQFSRPEQVVLDTKAPNILIENHKESLPLNINYNPKRHTNTYSSERKKIVISLKSSSPKLKSPKHKITLDSENMSLKKRHKKR